MQNKNYTQVMYIIGHSFCANEATFQTIKKKKKREIPQNPNPNNKYLYI